MFDCYVNFNASKNTDVYINFQNDICPDNINTYVGMDGGCDHGTLLACSKVKQYFDLVQRNDTFYDIVNPWYGQVLGMYIYLVKNIHKTYHLVSNGLTYPNSNRKWLMCKYKKKIVTFYQCYYQELDISTYMWELSGTQDVCDEKCDFRIM